MGEDRISLTHVVDGRLVKRMERPQKVHFCEPIRVRISTGDEPPILDFMLQVDGAYQQAALLLRKNITAHGFRWEDGDVSLLESKMGSFDGKEGVLSMLVWQSKEKIA